MCLRSPSFLLCATALISSADVSSSAQSQQTPMRGTAAELEQLVSSVPSAEYEVAQIRPSESGTPKSVQFSPAGLHFYRGFTLHDLLSMCWAVNKNMIMGEPAWANSDLFDISAKAPSDVGPPDSSLQAAERTAQMLRKLLVQRFKIAYHYADVPTPVYALQVTKNNTKLKTSSDAADAPCRNRTEPPGIRTYECHHIPMQMLASWLSNQASDYIDRPVMDFTNLDGAYDIHLRWATRQLADAIPNAGPVATDSETRTIFQAMTDQLGLTLVRRSVRLARVVIDHVEHPTSD
jgi:uncharacterized protein (TIGR03435 family)